MSLARCGASPGLHQTTTARHSVSTSRNVQFAPCTTTALVQARILGTLHVTRTRVIATAKQNSGGRSGRNVPNSKDGWLELIRDNVEPPPAEEDVQQTRKQRNGMPASTSQRNSGRSSDSSAKRGSSTRSSGKPTGQRKSPTPVASTPAAAVAIASAAAAAELDGESTYPADTPGSTDVAKSEKSDLDESAEDDAGEDEQEVEDWEEIRENRRLPDGRMDWELSETDPMYQPVLTDEMLAEDPPGHRSGYVSVVGYPNAGKSTLINALVGQKLSIVSYKPQTTRHRIMGIASGPDHQMILYDTPGIMEVQRTKLEERMMAAVVASIKDSEAILAVVDADHDAKKALSLIQPSADWDGPPMAVVLNKVDLVEPAKVEELAEWFRTHCRAEVVIPISAVTGEGVEAVRSWAVSKMPEGPTLYPKDMASQQPERFFVTEIVREKIFQLYHAEIPYACQVEISEFKERPNAKDFVSCNILVERESQVPILLGKGGAAVKLLSMEARKDIEAFLGRPVFLELSVKLAQDWRDKEVSLKSFGYYDQFGW